MNQRLVPRFPAAHSSQADRAEPAAPAQNPSVAGAAFSHFTESGLQVATRPDNGTPAGAGASAAAGAVITVALSPGVALILKLAADAAGIDNAEVVARAICLYAERIGIPSLARPAPDDIPDDLGDLPEFVRRDQMRFSRARETLRGK